MNSLESQNLISLSGSDSNLENLSIQYTIGENFVNTGVTYNYVVTQGFQQSTVVRNPDSLPYFNIGEIPYQTVYEDFRSSFFVWSKELGTKAFLSIKRVNDRFKGSIEFNSISGKFSIEPARGDLGRDTIIFMGSLNQDTVFQEVYFDIVPSMIADQTIFGLEATLPLPDESDDEFILITENKSEIKDSFNHQDIITSDFSIAGKTLIFDKNISNSLHRFLGQRKDITELNLYAEKIIIRTPLILPQTNLTIYARELIFDDLIEHTYISTQPSELQNEVSGNGKNGLTAGSINMYLGQFRANNGIRFKVSGGKGQRSIDKTGGNGGSGGILVSNLPLRAYADFSPAGGATGKSPGSTGLKGSFILQEGEMVWIHPFFLRTIMLHLKSAYINGHLVFPREVCEEYVELIDQFRNSNDWGFADEVEQVEIEQLQNEFMTILHRLDSNLDYFGNPGGWTPMLSFEINKAIFEQEVERALEILFYTRRLKKIIEENQNDIQSVRDGRKAIQQQLVLFESQYTESVRILPELKAELENILEEEEDIFKSLEELELELAERAKFLVEERLKCGWWCKTRKGLKLAGSLMSIIPVYQPALGAIGTGLTTIANFDLDDPISSITKVAKATQGIIQVDYDLSATTTKDLLKTFDISRIDTEEDGLGAYVGYFKDVYKESKMLYDNVDSIRQVFGQSKAPQEEISAEFEKLKAESNEYRDLITKAQNVSSAKGEYDKKIAFNLQTIASMIDNIQNSFLALNALDLKEFDLKSKQSLRVVTFTKDLEQRAKERLIKYHYYFAKAFEYRILEPYPNVLDLTFTLEKIEQVIDGQDKFEINDVKLIYDELINEVNQIIIERYNQNSPEFRDTLHFTLTKEDLHMLNMGISTTLNMVERGLFFPNEENIRIIDFKVSYIEATTRGNFGTVDLLSLNFTHSGLSKIKYLGEVYFFNHYNRENENPLIWRSKYDLQTKKISRDDVSPDAESLLLNAVLNDINNSDKLTIYSRPGAWADIIMTSELNSQGGAVIDLDSVRCQLVYDGQLRKNNLVNLEVTTNNDMKPLYNMSRSDNNDRKDGFGYLYRTFNRGISQKVDVTAPNDYGNWKFVNWTDQFGNALTTDTKISLTMTGDQMIRGNYLLIQPVLEVPDTIYLDGSQGSEEVFIRNTGTGDMDWTVNIISEWLTINSSNMGKNTGRIVIDYESNLSEDIRLAFVEVIAPQSIDYRDTIVVIQKIQSTSTSDQDLDNLVIIYPNPAKNILFLENPNNTEQIEIQLYDLFGREILRKRLIGYIAEIPVDGFPNGTYIIKVITGAGIIQKTFVKQ